MSLIFEEELKFHKAVNQQKKEFYENYNEELEIVYH